MLRTNDDHIVKISVMGELACPFISSSVYNISATGTPSILPGDGGAIYNLRVGNPACSWEADQLEPCVSAENKESDPRQGQRANTVFNILSCIGNEATIVTDDANGSKGVVTGRTRRDRTRAHRFSA